MGSKNKTGILFIGLLLGGIVIYSLSSLTTTKVVVDTTNETKLNLYKMSANNLIDIVNLYYAQSLYDQDNDETEFNGKINLLDKLIISGEKPDSGVVYMNENGDIYIGVVYENICFSKDFKEDSVSKKDMKYCSEE